MTHNIHFHRPTNKDALAQIACLSRAAQVLVDLLSSLKEGSQEYKAVEAELPSIGADLVDLYHL